MPSVPRLPPVLHVGALVYTVTTDRQVWLEASVRESNEVYGFTDHLTASIVLDPKQADSVRRDTLLHEVIHCCNETSGLAAELGSEWDERIARRLTPVLLATLRDNPRLVAYLTA